MAKQITVRGVTTELSKRLQSLSEARGESVNTTVLKILQRAVGIDERRKVLARYATWTNEDLQEFQKALDAQRVIDADLWK
jgi:hypothetical protein